MDDRLLRRNVAETFDRALIAKERSLAYILLPVRNDPPLVARLRAVYGGSLSRINLHDANASRQRANSTSYTSRFLTKVDGRRTQVYFGEELACIQLSGDFDLPLLTLNAPDHIGFRTKHAGTVHIGLEKLNVFSENGDLSDKQKQVLDSKQMRTLLAFHSFREGEAIHFFRNGLCLYLRAEDVTAALIRMLSAVANALPTASADV